MISDGHLVGDGSWTLKVYVTDANVERTLRVKGDTHIGGVMLKLVEDLGELSCDSADEFPLKKTRSECVNVAPILTGVCCAEMNVHSEMWRMNVYYEKKKKSELVGVVIFEKWLSIFCL